MPAKPLSTDTAAIERAASFQATIFLGTGRYQSEEHPTLADARSASARLAAEARNGRLGMVYAVSPEGRSTFVPDAYQPNNASPEITLDSKRADKATKRHKATAEAASEAHDAFQARQAPDAPKRAAGKRAAILEAAQRGELPLPPDFSAETHKRFREKLAKLVEMVAAGDIAGLKAEEIKPVSSSPKAMAKYRHLAVIALEAKGGN